MHGEHDHVDTSLNDGAADDLLGLCWSVSGEFTAAFDGVDDVHAFADSTKDGVVAVEPGRGHGGQEELGATGVAARVGHREHAGLVVLESESRWLAGGFASLGLRYRLCETSGPWNEGSRLES